MPRPPSNVTIHDLYNREDRIECDEAIDELKYLCETRYYAGFVAATLAVMAKLESGCGRQELGQMLAHWLLEAQVHATVGIDRIDAEEMARRLEESMREPHPERN